MKKILFTVFCLIGSLTTMKAQTTDISGLKYVLYVQSQELPEGATEATLSVRMKNEREADGFSFGIRLPEGFSFATDNDGKPDVKLSTKRTDSSHIDQFERAFQDEERRAVKVSASKIGGDGIIEGNEGEVALVHILLPNKKGTYTITIYEPKVSVKGWRSVIEIDEVETTFEIRTGINGVQEVFPKGQSSTYNLNGQQIEKPRKGINIQSGKKVLVK